MKKKENKKMRKFELINNTEPAKVMAEIGSTCVELEDTTFVSLVNSLIGDIDKTKTGFLSVVFVDKAGYSYDQIVHISQLKEIEKTLDKTYRVVL